MAHYAGVDLGATNVRAVVGTDSGAIVGSDKRRTPSGPAGRNVSHAVLDALRAACADADLKPSAVEATGVGSIGPLNRVEGVVRSPVNLADGIGNIPLVTPLKGLTDGRVFLRNDATAGVVGERFYADSNPRNVIYLTISTGIGAGVFINGKLLTGLDGNAGEVGHLQVNAEIPMECGCGGVGHWEAYCSGANIPRYAQRLHDGEETTLPIGSPDFSAADVFDMAGDDAFADRVLESVAEVNAQGVASLVHAYAPMVVYVGGSVATHNPEPVVGELRDRVPNLVVTNVPDVQLTTLGHETVVKGALASAITGGRWSPDHETGTHSPEE